METTANQSENATITYSDETGSGSDVMSSDVCVLEPIGLDCAEKRLWQIFVPIIIVVGLLGNLMLVIVFSRLQFSKSSTLTHMFVLAITDSVILCLGPTRHWGLNMYDFDIRAVTDAGCKVHLFLIYTTLDYSAWILVSVTVERVISVLRPLHVRGLFTVRRTVVRLAVILLLIVLKNGHFLISNGLVPDDVEVVDNTTSAVQSAMTTASANPVYSNDDVGGFNAGNDSSALDFSVTLHSKTDVSSNWTSKMTLPVYNVTTLKSATSSIPAEYLSTSAAVAATTEALETEKASSSSLVEPLSPTNNGAIMTTEPTRQDTEGSYTAEIILSYRCDTLTDDWRYFEVYYFVYIDMCVESFFPFIIMAVCNCFIIRSLRTASKNKPTGFTKREMTTLASAFNAKSKSASSTLTTSKASSREGKMEKGFENDSTRNLGPPVSLHKEKEQGGNLQPEKKRAISLWKKHKPTTQQTNLKTSTIPSISALLSQSETNSQNTNQSDSSSGVTRMLVLVTTVFVIATLPACVYYVVVRYLWDDENDEAWVNKVLDVIQTVTNLLQYSNYGCNFFLYSFHSKRFLSEVKYMLGLAKGRLLGRFNSSMMSQEDDRERPAGGASRSRQRHGASTRNGQRSSVRAPPMPSLSEADHKVQNSHCRIHKSAGSSMSDSQDRLCCSVSDDQTLNSALDDRTQSCNSLSFDQYQSCDSLSEDQDCTSVREQDSEHAQDGDEPSAAQVQSHPVLTAQQDASQPTSGNVWPD